MASVSLRGIQKIYPGGFHAVKDLNLEIKDKEFIVLVGPSGCGKSTTLRMVAGLEEISGGDLLIGDKRVNDVQPKDRDIAMVFQNYALYPHMTVFDNMAFALKLRHVPKDEIKRRVEETANTLDIGHLLNRKPKALSGGQRQRVALGRAIVRNPKVFLFDEPLSNLDAKLRVAMRTVITKLHQSLETTFIYVTHDQTEAMTMASRIVVMKDGVMQQANTPQNLYDYPANEFVASFIGSPQMNFFTVRLVRKGQDVVAEFGNNSIMVPQSIVSRLLDESYIGQEVTMGIRPENISDDPDVVANAAGKTMDVEVDVTEKMGSETYLYLKVSGKDSNVVARVSSHTASAPGAKIKVALDTNYLHFFKKDGAQETILYSEAVFGQK